MADVKKYLDDAGLGELVGKLRERVDVESDDTYVVKAVDAGGNLLVGFKESGEVDIPVGLTDDAYALIEALYRKVSDIAPAMEDYCGDNYDKIAVREALIEDGEDGTYVAKLVDGNGNLLQGFKESGEMEVPSGLTDDTYTLINSLYRKLLDVFPAIKDYADRTYEAAEVRKALIDEAEDEKYVLKMVDAEGNLLQGFAENGEAEIPSGLSDDAYTLINAVYNKLCGISAMLVELKERIDNLG